MDTFMILFLCLAMLIGILCFQRKACADGAARIPLQTLEPEGHSRSVSDFPVNVGIVFPEGEVNTLPGGRLVDDLGAEVPFEAEATGWWSSEKISVKWLLIRFNASTDRTYFFEPGKKGRAFRGAPLAVEEGEGVRVSTGPLEVKLSGGGNTLFDDVRLNGRPMLVPEPAHFFVLHDSGRSTDCTLRDWNVSLDTASSARADVVASGFIYGAAKDPVAKLELRYQFFKGESFVRLYHTLTWMVQDPEVGARSFGIRLRPADGEAKKVRVGLSDSGPESLDLSSGGDARMFALQDEAEHFQITSAGSTVKEGVHLGGWIVLEGDEGRSVSVSMRHAWETYPTSFEVSDGMLGVEFWPARAEPLSFMPEPMMGPGIYYAEDWKRHEFSKDAGHFVNNYEIRDGFMYTAEGAALTQELLIGFHDAHSRRSPEALNEVTQRQIVIRQDPESALRVPFMGFDLIPRNDEKYPDIERAVEQLGRLSVARWASENNHGLLRYGMVRWARHKWGGGYRWMDNVQYDQQIIPWLLFVRGGDRRWYEEGEITARYAMDMNVNHYNTRGSYTGYMATCGGALPFPNFVHSPWNMKGQKVHFLAYYWHLTGYPRAKEVLDHVISGTKKFAMELEAKGERHTRGGREVYNMNRFWSAAYQESFDPDIARLAAVSRQITDAGYDRETEQFQNPRVYLYNGMVLQARTFEDPEFEALVLRNANYNLSSFDDLGGVHRAEDVIGFQWAYEKTQDVRFAQAAWDIARGFAELTPDLDLDAEDVPPYPYSFAGHALFRMYLLPILVGTSMAERNGLPLEGGWEVSDLFLYLEPSADGSKPWEREAAVRAEGEGPIKLRFAVGHHDGAPLRVEISGPGGEVREEVLPAHGGTIVIDSPGANTTYRVMMRCESESSVLFRAVGGQVVHRLPAERLHANHPLPGGQYYTALRIYTRAAADRVEYWNPTGEPYTIRDTETGGLLLRPGKFTRDEAATHVAPGHLLQIHIPGCRRTKLWSVKGTSAWFSTSAEDWFDPEANQ